MPEIGFRMGLSDNLDMGIKLFSLGFLGDLKYAFIQNRDRGLSVAIDAGVGYSYIGGLSMYVLDIGPIISVKLGGIAPYVSARYRKYGGGSEDSGDLDFDIMGDFAAFTGGIELFPDRKVAINLEVNYMMILDEAADNEGILLFSGGLKFNF